VIRVRHFLMFQRAAFQALFRRRDNRPDPWPDISDYPAHPSTLCRCFDGVVDDPPALAHADHKPGCLWVAAMCKECHGTGWCIHCAGDGTDPEVADQAMERGKR
jgi:hypothetical protein